MEKYGVQIQLSPEALGQDAVVRATLMQGWRSFGELVNREKGVVLTMVISDIDAEAAPIKI